PLQRRTAERWRSLVREVHDDDEVFKPFAQSLQLDLAEGPDEAASPISFGSRSGRNRLVDHLRQPEGIGVHHVVPGPAACRSPGAEVIGGLARYVVPAFPALAD